ncbi:MAG: DUF370 domain-containing protein [Clostridiales bacterium]|jgi:hypothetical protein|nr:DUF370 domain-containing protein [Clostridiales bacterium]
MYLHLGKNTVIPVKSIIGVFDLDITSQSVKTRSFLSNGEKAKQVVNVSEDLPRSFVLCRENNKTRIYISHISSQTLQKRANSRGRKY